MKPGWRGLSAQWLKDELSSIFGASLIELWVGEDFAINRQQHATENWVFESEVEVVTTKKFGGI